MPSGARLWSRAITLRLQWRHRYFTDILHRILGFCPDFTLENWIQASRNVLAGADEQEKDLFEFNARALITTWGEYQNSEDCLLDYSNRQWAGLTESYCLKRWEDFVRRYRDSLKTGKDRKSVV